MSMQAPFVDAASAIDPDNFANTFISYYTYGAAVGLALDLAIREGFENRSLDSLMRRLWQTHGKTEISYTNADLQAALAQVTGSDRFASRFFERYINGRQLPDYGALLEPAGMMLRKAHAGSATAGPVSLEFDGKAALMSDNTIIGTPLYEAGLDRGDQIIAVDRLRITSQERWDSALGRYEPGDTARIRFLQRGIEREAILTFDEDPTLEVVTFESQGRAVSNEQLAFREAWLGKDSDD
jgi:predicted metalloprotease with PDZ domain